MLGLIAGTQATTQKTDCYIEGKNPQKQAVKHSMEKHILLNFVNLSTIICPRLSEEKHFHFQLGPDTLT